MSCAQQPRAALVSIASLVVINYNADADRCCQEPDTALFTGQQEGLGGTWVMVIPLEKGIQNDIRIDEEPLHPRLRFAFIRW